ncbi:hypothetical protein J4573_21115 [Actinomadura barringtoniae]|uniref:Uncharacterized protein n=1 Tax=Actinomadura barringtoniae TaxID=1427535 RepID=A0A939PBN0_9ACTN|nr:hypothetical protein [Actinomadura barringtoniae]MBO2449615.1 hypothetical protein [Actinomadura barringtoniae]
MTTDRLIEPATAVPWQAGTPGGCCLPRSGYTVRIGRGPDRRPALQIHDDRDGLLDVAVAHSLVSILLRGGFRARRGQAPWALAWGQLPPGCDQVAVLFAGRADAVQPVRPTIIARAFWVAEAGGEFRSVSVAADADRATRRLRREHRPPNPYRGEGS